MTSASKQPYDYSGDPDGLTREDVAPQDWMLEAILRHMFGIDQERQQSSFWISLNVSGALITGVAVSRGAWVKQLVEGVRAADADTATFLEALSSRTIDDATVRDAGRRERDLPAAAVQFIHLRDAKIVIGNKTVEAGLWRGRVDAIDGWSLGAHWD